MDDDLLRLCESSVPDAETAFVALFPTVVRLVDGATTPERMLGVVQALLRIATVVASASAGTKVDTLLRTEHEIGELAQIHWRAGKHMSRLLIQSMREQGKEIPPSLEAKTESMVASEPSAVEKRAVLGAEERMEFAVRNMVKGGVA